MKQILRPAEYNECKSLLKKVSRSFYLNTMALRHPIQEYVMISYLICRIADTVEDDPMLSSEQKKDGLAIVSDLLHGNNERNLSQINAHLQCTAEEREVMQKANLVFESYELFPDPIKAVLTKRINILIEGMKLYTFSEGSKHIKTFKDLDDYCYYVAGVIGELLTEVFSEASPAITEDIKKKLCADAVSFGLALQYTNIIKDFATDLHREDFFYPSFLFEKYNISKYDFLENREESRKILREMIHQTMGHIEKAMEYITLIPKKEITIRIFCLWPLFFAIRTLEEILKQEEAFLQGEQVKIKRKTVKKIIAFTSIFSISNRLLNQLYKLLVNRLLNRLWSYRFDL